MAPAFADRWRARYNNGGAVPRAGGANAAMATQFLSPRMELELSDIVRVLRLAIPSREVDGPDASPPQPRVGDVATVVGALGDDLYLIEHATDDGRSLWVAEFHAGELELMARGRD